MAVLESNSEERKAPKPAKGTLLLAHDLNYAKHLAANDEKERRRSLKYLKKYLEQRSKADPLTEESLQVLWKGLFYTMWMSDLPLVQEECAESIAHLMHALPLEEAMRFFKTGLATLQNEWVGIDQLRLNKFLMLVRRLLRQALVALRGHNFRKQANELFTATLEETVLSTRSASPLGLLMHFTEVYLEEVAKISEGKLQPSRTVDLLKPFVSLLAFAQDKRVLDWVNKFIFTHLLKQHRLGLEYEEKYRVWKSQGFAGSVNQIQKEVVLDKECEVPEEHQESKPLDPRAGRVDVELPEIPFHAAELAGALLKPKSDARTSQKTRAHLSLWADKFLKLHGGVYPLGVRKLKLKAADVDLNPTKAAKRLIRFEQSLMEGGRKRRRVSEGKKTVNQETLQVPIVNNHCISSKKKAAVSERPVERKKARPSLDQSIEGDYCFVVNSGVWFVTAEPLPRPQQSKEGQKLRGKSRASLKSLAPRAAKRHSIGGPKKVVINTRLNSSQNITEHIEQVLASPQPPWDSTRKPGKPLLKTPVRPSPINPFYKLRTF